MNERKVFIAGAYFWPLLLGLFNGALFHLFGDKVSETFITITGLFFASLLFYIPYFIFIAVSHFLLKNKELHTLKRAWIFSPIAFALVVTIGICLIQLITAIISLQNPLELDRYKICLIGVLVLPVGYANVATFFILLKFLRSQNYYANKS